MGYFNFDFDLLIGTLLTKKLYNTSGDTTVVLHHLHSVVTWFTL